MPVSGLFSVPVFSAMVSPGGDPLIKSHSVIFVCFAKHYFLSNANVESPLYLLLNNPSPLFRRDNELICGTGAAESCPWFLCERCFMRFDIR